MPISCTGSIACLEMLQAPTLLLVDSSCAQCPRVVYVIPEAVPELEVIIWWGNERHLLGKS